MLKILQARLQSMWTMNFQMFKLELEKAEEPEIKLSTSVESLKKQENSRKNIYFFFIDYAKAFNCVDHNKLWKILKRWEYQITLAASWEICMQVKKQPLELDMEETGSKSEKEYVKTMFSPCLFNLYVEYIMRNAGLDEAQAEIKIAGRNINNLRYADDTTFVAESKEELKIFLMKVIEESVKTGLKPNIIKTKIMASGPITSWQIGGGQMETVTDFIFLGSKITVDMVTVGMKLKDTCSLEEKLWQI